MKGILGTKVGMTQMFDQDSYRVIPVTVIDVGGCRVGQVKTPETDGYSAVQLFSGTKKRNKATKPAEGHGKRWGDTEGVPVHVVELRTDPDDAYEAGQGVTADVFEAGEHVDVVGVSKGKGFAGVMKRHNFKGQKASHGAHRIHRMPGAIGQCATPSRVLRGQRMAGHMGHQRVTVQNLEIVEADPDRSLILVRGAVPGPRGGVVMIKQRSKDAAPRKRKVRGF
ncbi:MAG: 50S ribosomal protein L3 [Acidimicrobiia bacterium]|nr:50S ribosomal protein L3 [Acidimicrobiia bacterium]